MNPFPGKAWVEFFWNCGIWSRHDRYWIQKRTVADHENSFFPNGTARTGKNWYLISPGRDQHHDTPFVDISRIIKCMTWKNSFLDNCSDTEITNFFPFENDIDNCYDLIDHIQENHSEKGASIQQTHIYCLSSPTSCSGCSSYWMWWMRIINCDTVVLWMYFRCWCGMRKEKNSIQEFLSQVWATWHTRLLNIKGGKGA